MTSINFIYYQDSPFALFSQRVGPAVQSKRPSLPLRRVIPRNEGAHVCRPSSQESGQSEEIPMPTQQLLLSFYLFQKLRNFKIQITSILIHIWLILILPSVQR